MYIRLQTHTMQNLTPHDIHVYDDNGDDIVFTVPRSEHCARLTECDPIVVGSLGNGVPVIRAPIYSGVTGIPFPDVGQTIVVSMPVGHYIQSGKMSWSGPVYGPDTSVTGCVRDEFGRIVGTKRFVQYN